MMKQRKNRRHLIQLIVTLFSNGYLIGFLRGKIFTGSSKAVCIPGLNCYSCPGAIGACPIGALQAVLGGRSHSFSYYVCGTLLLFGVLLGRFVCGFLCPFGFLQDLLYKVKTAKPRIPTQLDRPLRLVKYAILLFAVILLPIFLTDALGLAAPYFCQWICPAGTLEGGIPLLLSNDSLRNAIGFLFQWKMGILLVILLASLFFYRPFCKYLCPLGAFYALFNRLSLYRMDIDKASCTHCHACEHVCKMNVPVLTNINSTECIRCGDCLNACPTHAIHAGFCSRPTRSSNTQGEHSIPE